MINNSTSNAGDTGDAGLIPRSRRSPGGGSGNPLQYSCLGNSRDRGAWRTKSMRLQSQAWLNDWAHSTQHTSLVNNVALLLGVQQRDSVIHIHVSLFQILSPFRLLQTIEQGSLCYTVGPCWLSISKAASFSFLAAASYQEAGILHQQELHVVGH